MTFSLNNQNLFLVRLFLLIVIASPITASIGCRDQLQPEYEKLGLVDISGRVTLDGQPLANCTVIFEESEFLYSSGVTDANGNYKLMFDSRKAESHREKKPYVSKLELRQRKTQAGQKRKIQTPNPLQPRDQPFLIATAKSPS